MTPADVKTLLLISSTDKDYSYCFLFHFAKHWANKGAKVLYITHKPLDHLPQSVGIPNTEQTLENFYLIRFMYLPTASDLLRHCYSTELLQNPVSVIIVQELENYCVHEGKGTHDHVSLVCASLLQAAALCSRKNSMPTSLVVGFNSKNSVIDRTICKNFFHNIWEIRVESEETRDESSKKFIKLSNLSRTTRAGDIKVFVFRENEGKNENKVSFLDLETSFEAIIQTHPSSNGDTR